MTLARPRICSTGQQGFTLVEFLVSLSVFLVVLTGVYIIYQAGYTTFSRGEVKTDIQQNARVALATMERDLRMMGYGVPDFPCPTAVPTRITSANPTSITFRADLKNVSVTLTSQATAGSSTLNVNTSGGIAANDVIYITDGTKCDTRTVGSVTSTSLTITTGLTRTYWTGSHISRPKDVTYTITGGVVTRDERNPGAAPSASPPVLAENLQAGNVLRYFNAANAEILPNNPVANPSTTVRRIRMTLVTTDTAPGVGQQTYTLESDVRPRNF